METAAKHQAAEPQRDSVMEEAREAVYGAEEEEEELYDDEYAESSSSSEEDRREFGIRQCLPLEPGEDEDEEAAAVYAYLRQVRDEAKQLPDVVTVPEPAASQQTAADAPHRQRVGDRPSSFSRYLAADPGPAPCDSRLKPSAAWILNFLRQFARLRRRLQREYELRSGQATMQAAPAGGSLRLSPQLDAAGALDAAAAEELAALSLDSPSALMPELHQLQGQDQLQVRRQLHAAIRQVVRDEQLGPQSAPLLYALSARVEKPLHAGTCALYRQLLRLCAAQRAALADPADPLLPHLNVAIAVAGAYFRQDEELAAMWDEDAEEACLLDCQ